jgi:long-chain acyl-CoA synthetase
MNQNSSNQISTNQIWFQKYEPGVPRELIYPSAPLSQLLEGAAKRHPKRTAIEFLGFTMTYAELLAQAVKFAAALQAQGVTKGERVAIMLPNCPQFVVAFFGTMLAGAIAVNTSPLYVARELEHQLQDSGATTLVMLNLFYPRFEEIQARVPTKRVIVTGIQDCLRFPKNVLYPIKAKREGTWVDVHPRVSTDSRGDASTVTMWKSFLEHKHELTRVDVQPDDIALLQYTGGTTGTPKAAMLSHRNLMANVAQAAAWNPGLKDGEEVMLGVIPFFHVYGMTAAMNLAIKNAATMVLLPRFQVKDVLETIQKHKPTLFPGVPTMYVAINNFADVKKYDLSSIKVCISGAAPLPLEVARTFEKLTRGRLVEGYGLTESSPITHVNPVFGERREGCIGLPLPGIQCRIVDANGNSLPQGEVGELAISGPNIMLGYWRKPEETAKCILESLDAGQTPGRWLMTGDMVRMDADGFFAIVDRKKDMIDASGFNVYPREVEEVLYTHPAVQEVVVAGIPDAYRGETVKAFVILKEGQTLTEAELIEFARGKLSAYKIPRAVEFRTELPKTLIGKILRRALIEEERVKLETQSQSAA